MERRDILKEQAEQLGKMLGLILQHLRILLQGGSAEIAIANTQEQFQTKLDLDISELVQLPPEALPDYLDDHLLQVRHLDQLTTYLMQTGMLHGQAGRTNEQELYLHTALAINQLADHRSDTYSFDRQEQRIGIERALRAGPAGD